MTEVEPESPPPELARAPRSLPVAVTVQVLFGGLLAQLGWACVVWTVPFGWYFGVDDAIAEARTFRGEVQTAVAVVSRSAETNVTLNDRRVFAMDYEFRLADGREFSGTSYSTRRHAQGAEVIVEFTRADPSVSRIEGTSDSVGGLVALIAILLPVFGGLAGGIVMLRQRHRQLRLLRRGSLAWAVLDSVRPSSAKLNGQTVMEVICRFQDEGGGEHTVLAWNHAMRSLDEGAHELVIYDPDDPGNAYLLHELPKQPRAGSGGTFELSNPRRSWPAYLVLPALTVPMLLSLVI